MNSLSVGFLASLFLFLSSCDKRSDDSTDGQNAGKGEAGNASLTRTVSAAELANHASRASCWLVIDGVVYDVTKFFSEHPGGTAPLARFCGKDASAAFNGKPHSDVAKRLREGFRVGLFETGGALDSTPAATPTPSVDAVSSPSDDTLTPRTTPTPEVPADCVGEACEAVFTLEEVARHSTREDCWIILDGGVYAISDFFRVHPGGDAPVAYCGKDASEVFGSIHSDYARELRKHFRIGRLAQ